MHQFDSFLKNSVEKPTFITELKRETLSDYGSTVTLPCDANGVPPPTISWFHNTESVDYLLGTRYAQIFTFVIIGARERETVLYIIFCQYYSHFNFQNGIFSFGDTSRHKQHSVSFQHHWTIKIEWRLCGAKWKVPNFIWKFPFNSNYFWRIFFLKEKYYK